MTANQVKLTFAGDDKDLASSFDRVTSGADEVGASVERNKARFDNVGEAFGTLDTRAMGFRDTITGVQDTWKGLTDDSLSMQERFLTLGMGVGDLASGFENLIVPLASLSVAQLKTTATMVAGWASTAASAVASVATQVASWIVLGAQALISAAQVALAWLISIGPVLIVIAVIVGLVILIIANWDTIKRVIAAGWEFVKAVTMAVWNAIKAFLSAAWSAISSVVSGQINAVKSVVSGGWNAIKAVSSAVWNGIKATISGIMSGISTVVRTQINVVKGIFRTLVSSVRSIMSGLASAITAPFRAGFAGIKSAWNSSIGGRGFSVPSWVPGMGGKEFRIPRLAGGGIATGPTIAMVGEGAQNEAIIPLDRLDQMTGNGRPTVIELRSDGSPMMNLLVEMLRRAISDRGGDVQVVLGSR